jgi:PIN domain nuclease of toxin-antitoxin system
MVLRCVSFRLDGPPVLTADRKWAEVDVGVRVEMIR